MPLPGPTRTFLSFAPDDREHAESLLRHLSLLLRRGRLTLTHHATPLPGDTWAQQVRADLDAAELILLLLSADFLSHPQTVDVELRAALARRRDPARPARVIPILVRPGDTADPDFADLRPLPEGRVPVTSWPDRDAAWASVAASLRRVLDDMQGAAQGIDRDGVRRSLGHGAPLLRCDRGNQWDEVKRLLRRDGHDLILLTGEAGQAHEFFLARLERALPRRPRLRVCPVEWPRPRSVSTPPFPVADSDFTKYLARALQKDPHADGARLQDLLSAALREERLLLLHPLVARGHDEAALRRYHRVLLPGLLAGLGAGAHPCKVLQPIEWPAAPPQLSAWTRLAARLGNDKAKARRAAFDERAAARALRDVLLRPERPLVATALRELSPLTREDVVQFLAVLGYARDEEDPAAEREALAERVCRGDPTSEQVLRGLLRELDDDLLHGDDRADDEADDTGPAARR